MNDSNEKWQPSEWPPRNQYIIDNAFLATSERLKANPQWMPSRATNDSVGFDVRYIAPVENASVIILPKQTIPIDLGFKLDMPKEMCAMVLIQPELGIKHHLMLSNAMTIVSSDCSKNINVNIHNYSRATDRPYIIADGQCIVQFLFMPSAIGMAKLFDWGLKTVDIL